MKFSTHMRISFALACALLAACSSQPAHSQASLSEEQVLDSMDKAAASFRSARAIVAVDIYTSVVDSTETQKGKIYFRRQGSETQMALDMTDPPKYVLLSGGKLQLFEPKPDQVTVYDVSQHQDEYETFLKVGFGGGGHAMQKSFEVKYLGTEKIAGSDAAKLDLVPKNPKVLHLFPHILLWIDPARGVALQQQLFQDNPGDYRMTKYSDIQLNGKIPDSVFKLKTDGETKFQTM